MFGKYLKSLRKKLGLTQEQAAIKLNLLGGDLLSVDCVTFSRWERGITQPSLLRRIKVLRALDDNILPYLFNLGLEAVSSNVYVDSFELSLKKRYRDARYVIYNIDYQSETQSEYNHIFEEKLGSKDTRNFVQCLSNFHNQLKGLDIKHHLAYLDLTDYLKREKAVAYTYTSKGEMVGHNIGMFFLGSTLESEIDRTKTSLFPISTIDLRLSKSLKPGGIYSYYVISHHSKSERVFRRQLHTEFTFLAKNSHIHHYFVNVTLKSSLDIMLKMGFKVVTYEGESPLGLIRIASKRYTRAVMFIETCELFTRPEFFYLLTCCGECVESECITCDYSLNCIC